MIGRFLELSIRSPDLLESLHFWESLGFVQLPTGDIRTHHYGVFTDGRALLGIHDDWCEAPTLSGRVNHCIISSEPLQGENVWEELREGDVIGIDHGMQMVRTTLDGRSLAVVS